MAVSKMYCPKTRLGDIVVCQPGQVSYPDISVEDGIKIFLTGGMALPPKVRI